MLVGKVAVVAGLAVAVGARGIHDAVLLVEDEARPHHPFAQGEDTGICREAEEGGVPGEGTAEEVRLARGLAKRPEGP